MSDILQFFEIDQPEPLPFHTVTLANDLIVTLTFYPEFKGKTLKIRVQRPSDLDNTLRLLTYWIRPEEVTVLGGRMKSSEVEATAKVEQIWKPMRKNSAWKPMSKS